MSRQRADLTPLRGREAEFTQIVAGLTGLTRGRASIVVVSGPPGSGKSRLLLEALRTVDRSRIRTVAIEGDPDESFAEGGALVRSLRSGTQPLLDSAVVQELSVQPEQRYWLLEEIQERLEKTALETPILIVVDDLQWCDEFTLLALRALPQRLESHAVMWLFATRDSNNDPAVRNARDRLESLGAAQIPVDGLDDRAAAQMAADILDAPPSAEVLAMAREAGNRPALLAELTRGVAEHGVAGPSTSPAGGDMPVRFRQSVRRRLGRLSEQARTAVTVASVLSRQVAVGRLAALLDKPPGALLRPLQEALTEDLLFEENGQLVFRHDLVRDAIRESIPVPQQRGLRRQAAELAFRDGAPALEVAAILADSADPGDLNAITALRAASAELAASSPSQAADLSRRALALCLEGSPLRGAIAAEGIRLLWLAGRGHEASALGQALLENQLEPSTEAAVRLGIAAVSSQYSFTEAVRQCRTAVSLPEAAADVRAPLTALLAVNLSMVGDIEDSARAVAEGLTIADATGSTAARAICIATQSVVTLYQGAWRQAVDLADQAVVISAAVDAPQALWGATQWRGWLDDLAGRPDLALAHADRGMRAAQHGGQAWLLRQWTMDRCRLLFDAGRLDDARSEAEGVFAMADELGAGNYADCTALMTLARVAVHTGDTRAARRYATQAQRMQNDEAPIVRHSGLWLAALVAADSGDDESVERLLAEAARSWGGLCPALGTPPDPADDVIFLRLAQRLGRQAWAESAVRAADERAAANPDQRFLAAVAAHGRGLHTGDPALLRDAYRLYADFPRPMPYAGCAEDLAHALVRTGDRSDATSLLEQALSLYETAGATRDAGRIRAALKGLGIHRSRQAGTRTGGHLWESLTATESAVVGRVVEGATNREVAAAMFLSPHTVSTHLRHAFTKLNINSRVELTQLSLSRPQPSR